VLGLRHNLNQDDPPRVMASAGFGAAIPLEGGDRGAPNHRGYEWMMVPDRPGADPLAVPLPAGVVVALKHNANQAGQSITAFGRDPVTGPASFPGFTRQVGGDRGAPSGVGYFWYESTGAGFTGSPSELPNFTVVGLKHTVNQASKTFVWDGVTFDAGNPNGPTPSGFVRQCGGDLGSKAGTGFCWFEQQSSAAADLVSLSPPRVALERSLFVDPGSAADGDGDGLDDSLETSIADATSPFLRFDSSEHARRPDEPLTLYRIFRNPARRDDDIPGILVRWMFLFTTTAAMAPPRRAFSTATAATTTAPPGSCHPATAA
jgi:hypothetical protein